MADEQGDNGAPIDLNAGAGNAPQVGVIAQYIKDLSFENPAAPAVYQWQTQPQMDVQVNIGAVNVGTDVHEVQLKLDVTAVADQGTAFRIELLYAGLFALRNIPNEQLQPFLLAEGPRLLFPFARQIIADTVTRIASDTRHRERGVKVTALGALDVLPDRLRRALKDAEELTADNQGCHAQVAIGYGGRQEITDALRALLEDRHARGQSLEDVIDELSPEVIAEHLYTTGTPDPDLIIRTSGEIRLSGFLLWQSAHSEFYFCDPYWPAFRKTDFLRALRDFSSRQRRYGR